MLVKNGMYLFWNGELSNWFPSRFAAANKVFHNSEQYFMWRKAEFFGDDARMSAIMEFGANPDLAKKLGRQVQGFDVTKWDNVSLSVMLEACTFKFGQNRVLLDVLMGTEELTIVEASPHDTVWGIGLHETDPNAWDEATWQGENRLGKVLMQVRKNFSQKR
jgi:ribA/ribD-fused uncharacterized protein